MLVHGRYAVAINHGSTFLVAAEDGSLHDEQEQGLWADDTRFLSHYDLRINARPLRCIASSRLSFRHARWTLTPPPLTTIVGGVQEARITVTLDRVISARRLHEDIAVRVYGRERVSLLLSLNLAADFADLFEVRFQRWQRRSRITTSWSPPDRLTTSYNRGSFVRRCLLRITRSSRPATYANGELRFPVDVDPGEEWKVCLQYDLITGGNARPKLVPCPVAQPVVDRAERLRQRWHETVARARPADIRLRQAFAQAVDDFAALRLYDLDFSPDVWLPSAGIPWFVAVFGRDSIVASLQALPVHPLFTIGTLQKLAQWQSEVDDPVRDAEPGKICHEMRVGEWAVFKTVPHSPYYGTADATPLYLLLLAETYRWLGNSELLHRFRKAALRCLEWIDRYGDIDGDGFQEYRPRTPEGYRNHCWRDAFDGVLDEQGAFPPHPIGTCEMQAYVYAAKRSVAGLFEAWGDTQLAQQLRREAEELRRRFLDVFWVDGALAFCLDGNKRRVMTPTSNPGHCLLTGILDKQRAAAVAERLFQPDLFTGWGLRTLSSEHPAYDPHSYQCGSVWPHDTMIAAAGLRRYGRIEDAWRLIDGLLAAVSAFERNQMPELFAGLTRSDPDVPIPYEQANVPQAWAAGAIFMAVRILLGLEPDVPNGVVHIDPALPPWCPELEVENARIGARRVDIAAWRRPDGTSDAQVTVHGSGLDIIRGPAPWLVPLED